MESLKSDLMNRQHNVIPGRRALELIAHYDNRISEIQSAINERERWLQEDVRKLTDAQSRL